MVGSGHDLDNEMTTFFAFVTDWFHFSFTQILYYFMIKNSNHLIQWFTKKSFFIIVTCNGHGLKI